MSALLVLGAVTAKVLVAFLGFALLFPEKLS